MDKAAIVNRAATDETDPEEAAALALCAALGLDPWSHVHAGCEPRYVGYEGSYYMNWARDRIEEALAVQAALEPMLLTLKRATP